MSELTIKDYKKHIREKLNGLLDLKSEKKIKFLRMELLFLLNKINTKNIQTSGIEYYIDHIIETPKEERLEPFASFLTFLDKEFYEAL